MNKQYREVLIEIYLDWFNNYLSVEAFANDNGLAVEQAATLIRLGRDVARSEHPEA